MEKKILNNGFRKEPAIIPKSIIEKYQVSAEEYSGRKIWKLSPKNSETGSIILFFHGGAYYANITSLHWRFIEQILSNINVKIVVPDYPLAPEATSKDIYQFMVALYTKMISDHPFGKIIFMGDSSGGGLALGFAQKIKREGIKQPEEIILFSPWLDVSMSNPDIARVNKLDKILSVNGLKIAGEKYAGDWDVRDYRVSPIFGDFSGLGKISIFIGTNEIFIADARKLRQMLEEQQIDFNYFEYKGMFHDWVIVNRLKETKDVIRWLSGYLKNRNT
ncbi:MAG: alpha/beta hydrolase [Bacteroidales bacterium]|nr:alpha/beta hydrolase [Bacteroidales bacterium]